MGTLHEELNSFTISRSVLLKMRKISDKPCKETQKTYFMFNNFFPKIVPFMRYCGKILHSRGGYR